MFWRDVHNGPGASTSPASWESAQASLKQQKAAAQANGKMPGLAVIGPSCRSWHFVHGLNGEGFGPTMTCG